MHETSANLPPSQELRLALEAGTGRRLLAAGCLSLGLGVLLGLVENDHLARFLHSYLVSFCFVLSISLGALFFVAVLHVTRSGWGVVVRRIAELLAANVGLVALLFLPVLVSILVGSHSLYEWRDAELYRPGSERFSELLVQKQVYFQPVFYVARSLSYFAIWWLLARFFLGRSVAQDETGDPALTLQMERWSGPALILFGITVTFAAFDWLMSLTPEWFSTIFGVYYFAGTVLAGVSTVTLCAVFLQQRGQLSDTITAEHYHDLGKIILGFVIFWGYIGFSQYMLIWYANIPEETVWYLARQTNGWAYVSLVLVFGHLFMPYLGLLSRHAKRQRRVLAFWAIWMLLFHWLDMYWLVMPSLGRETVPFGLIDVAVAVGICCLFLAGVVRVAGEKSLVPQRDPRLAESLMFENY